MDWKLDRTFNYKDGRSGKVYRNKTHRLYIGKNSKIRPGFPKWFVYHKDLKKPFKHSQVWFHSQKEAYNYLYTYMKKTSW